VNVINDDDDDTETSTSRQVLVFEALSATLRAHLSLTRSRPPADVAPVIIAWEPFVQRFRQVHCAAWQVFAPPSPFFENV